MGSRRFYVIVLVCLFALYPAAAQKQLPTPPPPIAPDPQAAALLQQALNALKGNQTLSDVTLTGTAQHPAGSSDDSGTVTLQALATGEARVDLSLSSGQQSEIRTNSAKGPVGQYIGPDSQSHTIAPHNLITDSCWFFPALLLQKLGSAQSIILSNSRQETRNGKLLNRFSASRSSAGIPIARMAALLQHNSKMDIYVDPSTNLPATLVFNTHPDNDASRDALVEIQFSDYRAVNGIQVPFHIQKYFNHGLFLDIQLDSATFNTGLTASSLSAQ